jgi:DNA invertase Pin-like site-specific DNA recombinase
MPRPLRAPAPIAGVRTLAYIRVSTEQQATDQRTSLGEQRAAVLLRAKQLGITLDPSAIFEDPGASGATAEGRPGFMAMLAYCEGHPRSPSNAGTVLVLNDSRFGRFEDPEEATYWRVLLRRLGWIVRFCEGDDIENTTARMIVRSIGSAQASEYRENLKRTARRATRATAEQGRWQNKAPLGFRRLATRADGLQRVLEAGHRKADDETTRLTPGPDAEQALVRFIFETYASGTVSLNGLYQQMVRRWPNRRWAHNTINTILKNPAYVGDVVWCRRPHDAHERRARRIRPREEWVVVQGAHPPLVSRALFEACRARLAINKIEKRATAGGYPLSGMIVCGTCDSPFIGGGGRRGPDGDLDRFRFYRDGATDRRVPCPGRLMTLRKRWLEPLVIGEIAKVVADKRVQAVIAEELDRTLAMLTDNGTARQAALRKEREQIGRQRDRIVAMVAADALSERDVRKQMAEVRSQLEAIESEIEQLQFSERRTSGVAELRDRLLSLAADFPALAKRASGPALRELIRPWLAKAVLDKKTHVLTLHIRKVPDVMGLGLSGIPSHSLAAPGCR